MINGFALDSLDLTDAVFEQCSTCDARSDRAGSKAVGEALKEYMTRNHVKILLERGKFLVSNYIAHWLKLLSTEYH